MYIPSAKQIGGKHAGANHVAHIKRVIGISNSPTVHTHFMYMVISDKKT